MKSKRILALLLISSMLTPAMLCSCKTKGGSSTTKTSDSSIGTIPSETDDERPDLGASSETNESSVSETDPSGQKTMSQLSAYSGPALSLQSESTYLKGNKIDILACDRTLRRTIPEVACCAEDGLWFLFFGGELLHTDYEGNHIRTYQLGFLNEFTEVYDYILEISNMYVRGDDLYLLSHTEKELKQLKLDKESGKLSFDVDYPVAQIGGDCSKAEFLGMTDDEIFFSIMYENSSIMSYLSALAVFSPDGKFKNSVILDDNFLGCWYMDDQLSLLFTEQMNAENSCNIVMARAGAKGDITNVSYLDSPSHVRSAIVCGSDQYLVDDNGIWKMDTKTGKWSNTMLWSNSDFNFGDFDKKFKFSVSPDGQKVLLYNSSSNCSIVSSVSVFTPGEDPREGRTVIPIAYADHRDTEFAKLMTEFNKENQDYYIETYYETLDVDAGQYRTEGVVDSQAYDAAFAKLQEENLRSGKGPVLYLEENPDVDRVISAIWRQSSWKQDDDIFAHDEYFEDLLPLWDQEDPKWQELFLKSVIDSCRKNGHMYGLPFAISELGFYENAFQFQSGELVRALVGDESYAGWLDYLKKNQFDSLNTEIGAEDFLFYALSHDLSYFTKEDGTVDLDDPQFRAMLEIAKDYLISYHRTYITSTSTSTKSKRATALLTSYDPVAVKFSYKDTTGYADYKYMGKGERLSFPSADGGSNLIHASRLFYMAANASQEQKDGAWAFLRFIMQKNSNFNLDNISYMLDAHADPSTHEDYWLKKSDYYDTFVLDDVLPLSSQEIEAYRSYIMDLDNIVIPDQKLYAIIYEEVEAYMQGKESADELIPRLQKRINDRK